MGITRNCTAVAVLALAAVSPTFVGTASAAQLPAKTTKTASGVINHSCGPKANPDKLHRTGDYVHTTIGSARITLRFGFKTRTSHTIYFWAKITGASKGNKVWLDWGDSTQTPTLWHQCGPYTVHSGHDQHTPAVNYVSASNNQQRSFRSCGHHAGKTKCTHWEN